MNRMTKWAKSCFRWLGAGAMVWVAPLLAGANPDGSFSHSIPIKIPNGRNGMQPSISINYNSNGGNGQLGVGWSLSGLGAISRGGAGGAVPKYDATDLYYMDGAKLVPSGGEYRAQVESWARIVPSGTCGVGPCSFTVTAADGSKRYYGTSTDSRIEAVGKNGSVRTWALHKAEDANGNFYEVSYNEDTTNGDYYPSIIAYTKGNGAVVFHTVNFHWQARSDVSISYAAGAQDRADQRMTSIEVKSGALLQRKYNLAYDYSGAAGASRLVSVEECGTNGTSCYPSQTFDYTGTPRFAAPQYTVAVTAYTATGDSNTTDGIWLSGDIDGDGKTDFIHLKNNSGLLYTWKSNYTFGSSGSEGFTVVAETAANDTCLLSCGTWQTGDVNGDGRTDLIHITTNPGVVIVWKSKGDGTYSRSGYTSNLDTSLQVGTWQVGDVDGDGRTDLVHLVNNSGQAYTWFSTGGTFNVVAFNGSSIGDVCLLTCGTWRSGDVNADGISDLIHITNVQAAGVMMWLSKGQGAYSMLQRTSSVDSDLKNGLWLSGDLNGNGKTDLFHATTSAGKVIAWRHSGNNGDRLFLISNGVGSETRVVYTIPSVADGAIGTIEMGDYPHVAVAGSGPLVTKIDTLSGSETFSQAYHYTNRRGYRSADWEERRALGFRWVKQIDSATGNSSITYYSQGPATGDTLDMAGSVMSTETRDSGGALWSKSVNTYEMGGSTAIAGQKQAPRVKQEESYTYNAGTLINKSKKVVNFTPEGLPSGVSQYHGLSDTLSFTTSTTYGGNCGGLISAMPTQVVVTAASSGGTRTTSTSYDSKCNAVSKTEGGQTTTTVYNVAGQPASTTDPRGATTTITYGGSGAFANSLVETVSNALGHTVTNLYDDYGRLIEERDANHGATGQSTVRAYDALHRPVSSSVAGQLRTKFSYPSWTETKMETLMPDGVTWRATIETRDGLGRLTQTRQQVDDGSVVKWAYVCKKYDSLGREIGSSQTAFDACQNTYIATAYDALGRVSSVSFPDGRPSVSYIYNGLSTTVRTAGDAARDVTVTHDARGRVVSRTEPESATVNYTYNDFDQVLTASVVGGGTITTTYDSLGRKQTVKDTNVSSASTLRTFTYKANGDLQSMADANGKTITYDYDILGRVTRRCYGTSCTSSNAEVVTYDTAPIAGGVGTMKGSVHTVSRPALGHEVAATQTNSFDAQGRHDRSLVTIDGQTYVSQSHYTALGSERCATLPDGSVIRTEPTVSGAFLKAVEYKDYTAGGECEGGTVKHRVAYSNYSPTGTVGQVQYFSGSTTPTNTSTYTYTPWGGVATAKTVQGTAGTRIEDLTYEYTGLLELRRVTDNLKAVYGGVNTDRTQAYRYDKQGRLIQAAAGQGASCTDSGCTAGNLWGGTKSYSFNAMGNLTNKEGQALTYDSSKKQQLTAFGSGKSYAYDANGNVTLKKNGTTWWRYTYNDNNMLTQVEKSINSGSSYVVVERNTFIGETRIKKDYMPNQSSARVQTYYLGGAFEVRKQPDGKKIHSTYLLGPTGRVASFTIDAGANPAYMAAVNSYTQYAAAAMLGYGSTHSIAKKVSHWVKGFAYSAAGQRIFAYTLLLLASGLIFLLVLGVRQWVLRLRQVEVPSLWQMTSARVATVTASALLAFNAGFIGCLESMSTSSSLVAATLTFAEDGHTIMAFKSLGNALTGDTTSGPPPGSYWMLNNHVGSNSVIVHAVNQGSATAGSHASTVNYFPYGEVNHANSPGQDLVTFKFTGQEYDAETSLYHYGARMYDPQTGRFLTPDTILPGGGKSQGFNRYMYVFGNPISYTDPTGHTPEDDRKKAAQEREAIAMYKAAWKTGECNSVSSCFAVVNKYAALWRSMLNGTRAGARDARSDGGPYKEKGSYEDMTGGTSVVVGGKAWDITEKEAIMLVSLGMVRAALIDGSVKDYQRTIHDAYKIGQNTGGGVLVIHAPVPANEWFNERDGAIHRGKTTVQDIDTPRGTYSVPVAEYYVGSRETQDAHIVAVISKIADAAAIRGTKKFDFYSHSYGGNLTMQALAGKDRSTHGNITHYAASPAFPSSALDSAINGTVGGPLDKAMAGTTLRTFIAHGGVLDAGARDDTWNPKVFSSAAEKRDWTDLQKQIFNNANISWVNFKLGKDGHDAQKLWAGCNGWSTEDQCN